MSVKSIQDSVIRRTVLAAPTPTWTKRTRDSTEWTEAFGARCHHRQANYSAASMGYFLPKRRNDLKDGVKIPECKVRSHGESFAGTRLAPYSRDW